MASVSASLEPEARGEVREVFAHRQRGGGEHPGRARAAGQLCEARRDVERQQAQGETALRELDAARAFVLFGVHDGVEPRGQFRGAPRALRDRRLATVFVERGRELAQRARQILRRIGERRIRGEPVGSRRGPQDFRERQQRISPPLPNSTRASWQARANCRVHGARRAAAARPGGCRGACRRTAWRDRGSGAPRRGSPHPRRPAGRRNRLP